MNRVEVSILTGVQIRSCDLLLQHNTLKFNARKELRKNKTKGLCSGLV